MSKDFNLDRPYVLNIEARAGDTFLLDIEFYDGDQMIDLSSMEFKSDLFKVSIIEGTIVRLHLSAKEMSNKVLGKHQYDIKGISDFHGVSTIIEGIFHVKRSYTK